MIALASFQFCNPVSVESRVMSDQLRQLFTTVEDHQQQQAEHPTDDLGWPLCKCAACRAKSDRMNAAFIDSILRHGVDPDRTLPSSALAEVDYDGDGGREWQDQQRSQHRASSHVPRLDLPHVKAPSIVPTGDDDA